MPFKFRSGLLLSFLLGLTSLSAKLQAQLPNLLIYDQTQSQTFGSENLVSIQHLVYRGMDEVIPQKFNEETNFGTKSIGIGYRFAKIVLLDFQMDFFLALSQHEAYGHASRYREFEFENIKYNLNFFPPLGPGGGSASATWPEGYVNTITNRMLIGAAGNEGNTLLADNLEARMILGRKLHYRQSLLYLTARNNLLVYTASTYWRDTGGDVANYLERLNTLGPAEYDLKTLFIQNLSTFANPIQFYAAWTLSKKHLIDGDTNWDDLPMIPIKDLYYLPTINFNLTPFGAEFFLNNYLLENERLWRLQVRLGESTFRNHLGLGLDAYNILQNPRFRVNASAHLWHQPSFEFGIYETILVEEGLGGMATASLAAFPFQNAPNFGLYGQLGYKSYGYFLGEPLDKGWILRFGLAMELD